MLNLYILVQLLQAIQSLHCFCYLMATCKKMLKTFKISFCRNSRILFLFPVAAGALLTRFHKYVRHLKNFLVHIKRFQSYKSLRERIDNLISASPCLNGCNLIPVCTEKRWKVRELITSSALANGYVFVVIQRRAHIRHPTPPPRQAFWGKREKVSRNERRI